jgi:hypothetical protein
MEQTVAPVKTILLLFSRPQLCANGGFDDASGWTAGAGWVVGGGVATATATSTSLRGGMPRLPIADRSYKVEFDWTHNGGTLNVAMGLGAAATFTTSGRKSVTLVCGASASRGIEFYGGTVSGVLDNVSIRLK